MFGMRRIPVESSDIVSIGYDPDERTLEVEFGANRIYRYREVAPDIHAQFMKADSYGRYFFAHINGRYRYEKISEKAPEKTKGGPIAFVTGNKDKFRYLQQSFDHFDIILEQLELPVDEVQSNDPSYIAQKKAKEAFTLAGGGPVIVNDAFWNILALKGFPGAYMSPLMQWLQPDDFLKLLEGHSDRTIVLTDSYAYYDGERLKVFSKEHMGAILQEPKGEGLTIQRIATFRDSKSIAETIAEDRPSIDSKETAGYDLAKWLHMQRRLGLA